MREFTTEAEIFDLKDVPENCILMFMTAEDEAEFMMDSDEDYDY